MLEYWITVVYIFDTDNMEQTAYNSDKSQENQLLKMGLKKGMKRNECNANQQSQGLFQNIRDVSNINKKGHFLPKKGHLKFKNPLFKLFKKDFTRNILLLF